MAFKRPVRSRPIRVFLISMFAVPLVSLLALWGFAASITVSNAVSDHRYNASATAIASGVRSLTVELPQERVQSYLWLLGGRTSSNASMLATRKAVDKGIPVVRAALSAEQGQLSAASRSAQSALFSQIAQLGKIRAAIDGGTMSPSAAFAAYDTIVDDLYSFFDSAIQDRGASLAGISVGAADSGYATELAGREAALVGGAFLDGGQMSPAVRQQFVASAANRHLMMNEALALMTPDLRAGFLNLQASSPAYQQFEAMESQVLASPGPVSVNAGAWAKASLATLAALQNVETVNGNKLTAMSASLSNRLVLEAFLVGGLGLAAVAASVFLLVWFGRKVTRDLTGLNRQRPGDGYHTAAERGRAAAAGRRRGRRRRVAGARHQQHRGDLADRGVVRHRPVRGRLRRRRPGQAAQGSQPGLPEHLHAQPVPAAPAAGDAGLDGAADQRAGRARRPVPARPPHHAHAPGTPRA